MSVCVCVSLNMEPYSSLIPIFLICLILNLVEIQFSYSNYLHTLGYSINKNNFCQILIRLMKMLGEKLEYTRRT